MEWSDKRKYKKTLENMVENHVILMKFFIDNSGENTIEKYYSTKNEMNYKVKIGKGVKIGAKLLKTLSKRKILDLFITQLIRNVQYMIPIKCISGVEYEENKATIHIDQCRTKDIFRRGIKKYKVRHQIKDDAFCKLNCIPAFQTYGRIGDIKVRANLKDNGCDIIGEFLK